MHDKNDDVYKFGSCFTGSSTVGGQQVDNATLWSEGNILDTEDPGFQAYCDRELELLNQLEETYKDSGEHGLMMTYIRSLRRDTECLKKGISLETGLATVIFGGDNSLTKMKDVLIDLEPEEINKKDFFQSNYKDTTVYESTAKEFGITELYEEYNATMETGVEWQVEWQGGDPDPEKLSEIGDKLRRNIQQVEKKLNDDPKAMEKAVSAAKSGHGGALDDLFRKHVKELPAGSLSNNPLLARYMPTVKERIEFLQTHLPEDTGKVDKYVAEIIALRNLVHAERGKKSSLDKPIPTDPESSLQVNAKSLWANGSLQHLITHNVGKARHTV